MHGASLNHGLSHSFSNGAGIGGWGVPYNPNHWHYLAVGGMTL